MARESEVGHHTLDRIYGRWSSAADGPGRSASSSMREAEAAIVGPAETCPTCRIAFVVPAAIAAAQAGDLDRAQRYAADAETAIEVDRPAARVDRRGRRGARLGRAGRRRRRRRAGALPRGRRAASAPGASRSTRARCAALASA